MATRRKLMRRLGWTLFALGFAVAGGAWWLGGRLIAPAHSAVGTPPPDLHMENVELTDRDGRVIRGWITRAPNPRATALLLHGIRGDRRAMVPRARMLRAHGISSVLVDLQAHGESDGDAIGLGAREQHGVRAAVDWIRSSSPQQPLFVVGVSLGGAAAALASPLGIDGLVLESVFPDVDSAIYHRVEARLGPLAALPAWLLRSQLGPRLGVRPQDLRPVDAIGRIQCPLLMMSGAGDPHTPESETRRLFEAAPEPRSLWMVPGAGHVDLCQWDAVEYEEKLLGFLDGAMGL